jgi:hypothetical protein
MGSFVLLPRRSFLGMVLPLSLFYKDYRFVLFIDADKDIKKGLKVDMNFELGQPFKPFEQLMGVLPSRSRKLLPEAFRVMHRSMVLMLGSHDRAKFINHRFLSP